jgi:hypothetical protein
MYMNLFSRLFGSHDRSSSPAGGGLERRLAELEKSLEKKPPGARGMLLNKAGDLCERAGDRHRAVLYFGRAIDAFLEDEQPVASRGVAKKIIRVHPSAVRTLCTLTWLDLSARQYRVARDDLEEYVTAAKAEQQAELAAEQILEMGRTVSDPAFLEAVVEALEELGFPSMVEEATEWVRTGEGGDAATDSRELQKRCLERAMESNARQKAEGAAA